MDPLSVAAGIVGLAVRVTEVTNRLRSIGASSEKENLGILEELSVYEIIFRETSETLLKLMPSIPPSAEQCLRMCYKSIRPLEVLTEHEAKKRKGPEIEKQAQPFIRSVVLFRNIVMDNIIHKLVTDQQGNIMSILHTQEQQEEVMTLIASRLDKAQEKDPLDIDQLAAKLHATISKSPSTWMHTESDPFSFNATILSPGKDRMGPLVCRGLLDSGSEDNWMSSDLLTRGGLLDQIFALDDAGDTFYAGFGGNPFKPEGIIALTWHASNSATTKDTTFLVHPSAPFDMILGKKWIAEESIFVFDKPALALRQGNFSREELLQVEKKAREKGVKDNQVSAIRRVADASAREHLRQQKALSRSMSRPATGSSTPLSNLTALSGVGGSGSRSGQTPHHPPRPESIAQSSVSSTDRQSSQLTSESILNEKANNFKGLPV